MFTFKLNNKCLHDYFTHHLFKLFKIICDYLTLNVFQNRFKLDIWDSGHVFLEFNFEAKSCWVTLSSVFV